MINSLYKKLNRIFVLFTSCLFLLLLVFVVLYNIRQVDLKSKNNFNSLFYTIMSKLQTDDVISSSWLSSIQQENHLIVIIDDNGNLPSTYSGKKHLTLMKQLQKYAAKEDISLTTIPLFTKVSNIGVHTVTSGDGTIFYGSAAILYHENGYRGLYLFQQKPPLITTPELIFYFTICIIGFVSICLLSHFLIAKALLPVRHSQEQQNQFIAAASHELRSPLTVIRANNSHCKSEEDSLYRSTIEHECVRMSRLVSDLLALSNMDAQNYICQKEVMDCDSLLLEIYDAFQPVAATKGIKIEMHLPEEEMPKITGDYERMKQILSILIDNAITYSPANKPIFIEGSIWKNYLKLKVIDHGLGISDEEKAKVFERFYRVDEARRDKEHFGLGLSIAKQLVELHNGTLTIEDTPSGGATFVLEFGV